MFVLIKTPVDHLLTPCCDLPDKMESENRQEMFTKTANSLMTLVTLVTRCRTPSTCLQIRASTMAPTRNTVPSLHMSLSSSFAHLLRYQGYSTSSTIIFTHSDRSDSIGPILPSFYFLSWLIPHIVCEYWLKWMKPPPTHPPTKALRLSLSRAHPLSRTT